MANIWNLEIKVVDAQDAEKMKDCVRELSKEYELIPTSNDPNDGWYQAGLEYGDDFVCYTDGFVERLEQFTELAEKVAAQFPEMPLLFTQFNTDNQGLYRYESKDGEFVRISPLKVTLHTNDAEDFSQLLACAMPLLTAQGMNAEVNTATQEITWGYSEENESQVCDALITKMSEQIPDIQVVCMKHDVDNHEFSGLQYCIVGKGEGEWKKITGATFNIAYAIWYAGLDSALELTVYDAFTDPARCVKVVLEMIRKGYSQGDNLLNYSVKDIIFQEQKYLYLLQPEDKQWLLDLDRTEADCIVLAGMYHSWHTWEESFTDSDTGETVTVERHEILTTPLFESHEGEAEALLEKVCNDSDTLRKIKDIVWTLSTYTPLNYTRLLVDNIENLYADRRWACKEIGDLYRWGKEEFGFFIDKQKAKEYYDKAEVADENPLNDSDEHDNPDPCTYIYTVRGDIAPLKELTEKIANKYGDTENELGWYVPMNIFMYYLVGTDPKRYDYCGNLLSAEEKDGALQLMIETERGQKNAFAYALKAKFPELEVEIEEEIYEDDMFK